MEHPLLTMFKHKLIFYFLTNKFYFYQIHTVLNIVRKHTIAGFFEIKYNS